MIFGKKFNLDAELDVLWDELRTIAFVRNHESWKRFIDLLLSWVVEYDMQLAELTGDSKEIQRERQEKQITRRLLKRLLSSLETTLDQEKAVRERILKLETIRTTVPNGGTAVHRDL